MYNLTQKIRMFSLIALIVAATAHLAQAQSPQAMDAYVQSYSNMGKQAALMFNQMTQQINARAQQANSQANMVSSRADAQAKIMVAQATWLTAVVNAEQTRAKTLQTLEELRGQKLENDLKHAQTFYNKKKMYQMHKQEKRNAYYARKAELRARRAGLPYIAAR